MGMSDTRSSTLKDIFELSLQTEMKKIGELDRNRIVYQSISEEQVNHLVGKIVLLPFEYRSILFFRYCFGNSASEMENILGIQNSEEKLCYIQKMLSHLIGFKDSWIDEESMKKASRLALKNDMVEYKKMEPPEKPKYSSSFRKKLKGIRIKGNLSNIILSIGKKVAIFILVCILSLSAVLTVNAKAREKFFRWIVETFSEFSIFTSQGLDEEDVFIELDSLEINYIPIGLDMEIIHEGRRILVYNYLGENDEKVTVKFIHPLSGGKAYYDTENAEIKEITFKESQAYTWQTDSMAYLIWYQDGIECHVSGSVDIDEIFKVAENIVKKE